MIGYQEEVCDNEGSAALKQVVQRGCGPSWHSQGQAGPGSEQPDLAADVPAHYRDVGPADL